MAHGYKVQALEIYNSNLKSKIPSIKLTGTIIDVSVVVSAKAIATTAKTFEQFPLVKWYELFTMSVSFSRIDDATDSYIDKLLKTDTKYNRGSGQY